MRPPSTTAFPHKHPPDIDRNQPTAEKFTDMVQNPDIVLHLATRLREARRSPGLSLDALAKRSGVSGSMVSQIERGESSPTVATLWNLTQALQVDFAELFETQARHNIRVVPSSSAPVIEGRGGDVIIRILSAPQTVGEHEIYDIRFKPGGVLDSAPHRAGCREDLVVVEGSVSVKSGDELAQLTVDDAANYAADCPHCITAGKGPARILLIVQNS